MKSSPTGPVFSDSDLIARLTDTEDHFTERKSKSDKGGWVRTTVAFANSAPIGYPALLFVGVMDDGTITDNGEITALMKSYSDAIAANCYPPIYTMPRVFSHNRKSCVSVTIPGSEARPHFAGLSYIRDGTQTKEASEQQFERLIADRQSKAREILKWKGRNVSMAIRTPTPHGGLERWGGGVVRVVECNQFYVEVEAVDGNPFGPIGKTRDWIPLGRIVLSGCPDGLVFEVVGYK